MTQKSFEKWWNEDGIGIVVPWLHKRKKLAELAFTKGAEIGGGVASDDTKRTEIESLIDKAAKAEKSEDALRFSQAACNAANAMRSLRMSQKEY